MVLRPYQEKAVDAATAWMRRSVMAGLLELATGAGKSHIVAAIAAWVYETTGKRVLCLQPSKELTEQNWEKYTSTGAKASIFSASAGGKCMRHPVVYGTPGTVKNHLSRFGDQFGAVIIDEAHGITETIKIIVGSMQKANPYLRVLGMTATPYRTNSGFIYQYDVDGSFVPEDEARSPWFNTLLYRITTNELIDMGFLTPAHADPEHAEGYDASGIQVNRQGKFDAADLERVFEGHGRLTSQIVSDVVSHSHGRRGVMLFAATVQHAKEIMASLPPANSRMLGGDVNMQKKERERLIEDFKAMRFKYLVSVATLTTGFDAPHVDLIALLRATESPGLLQQIIGRGLRLCDGKADCLVLDYADNIDRHQLHNDLFKPQIKVRGAREGGGTVQAKCPSCGFENEFSARPNPDQFSVSEDGYFLDLAGMPVEVEGLPIPAHFGRRCNGQVKSLISRGVYERCEQRWSSKECPECNADNDIAARYCCECKEELVDPNVKLTREFIKIKRDPYSISTDRILSWTRKPGIGKSGNPTMLCEFVTEYRSFKYWFTPDSQATEAQAAWRALNNAVYRGHQAPSVEVFLQHFDKASPLETVTYFRKRGSEFHKIFAFNKPADKEPGQ